MQSPLPFIGGVGAHGGGADGLPGATRAVASAGTGLACRPL